MLARWDLYYQIATRRLTLSRIRMSEAASDSPKLPPEEVQDLICVGFGPASLAIAIALHDAGITSLNLHPKVFFLERQARFGWHSGMQLPGAKMQISFLKDLATPRNPQSRFSFVSYLYQQNRLNYFINLGIFTPTRVEYEDYLRWCARHFEQLGMVFYGEEVVEVAPDITLPNGKVTRFRITSRDINTRETTTRLARHVVIAVGGKAMVPKELPQDHPRVIHSSQYSLKVNEVLSDPAKPYTIAVVGNGQSAAEIFNDLSSRYPYAKVSMIIRGSALRPSVDSPFVNEIFDPERVDGIYQQTADIRAQAITMDRATNYGVVRLDLLEHIYQRLYMQRLQEPNPDAWNIQIKTNRQVTEAQILGQQGEEKIALKLQEVCDSASETQSFELVVDAVFVATGYVRNVHEDLLRKTRCLMTDGSRQAFRVRRDYKIEFDSEKVADNAGVWLQGCNESTHGVSCTVSGIA